ncbi:MAG: lamin tail domain-containing protein, partial [Patescibacteria group bacterium]
MKKIIFIFFILTTFYLILNTFPVFAQSKISINEFLIDPQPQSVEIFNSGTQSADISDWIIDDSGGTTFYTIPNDSIVFPNQCLVFSGDFNLNKSSADTIKLINSSQQLIDSFSYKSSSGSGISYFRQPDATDSWATGSATLGFYNSSTEQTCLFPTLTPSPTITLIPTLTPTPIASPEPTAEAGTTATSTPQSYDNIYLSEVMVNPTTGEKEWVEIFNNNDFSVILNGWYIDDLENSGSSSKIFSLEISRKSYAVFNLTSSMFNNDGDSVLLLDSNKNLKDDFEYSKSEQGKTLG